MTTTDNGQRDELVKALWCKPFPYGGAGAYIRPDANASHAMADVILAAGYRKPRTITTVEELDGLSDESVVRSDFGVTHEKRVEFGTGRAVWVCPGDSDENTAGKISLPATVLYEPEAEVGA